MPSKTISSPILSCISLCQGPKFSLRDHEALERFGHPPRRGSSLILRLPRRRLRINEKPEIRNPPSFGLLSGRLGEDVVNNHCGGYAPFLQPYSVPHGAAGAGPSGADAYNDQLCTGLEFGNFTLGCGGREGIFFPQRSDTSGMVNLRE
jgi:hypothetical protein